MYSDATPGLKLFYNARLREDEREALREREREEQRKFGSTPSRIG